VSASAAHEALAEAREKVRTLLDELGSVTNEDQLRDVRARLRGAVHDLKVLEAAAMRIHAA
jgi:hypothetical protein